MSGCNYCDAPTHGTADCIWKGLPRCHGGVRHRSNSVKAWVACDRCGKSPKDYATVSYVAKGRADSIRDMLEDKHALEGALQDVLIAFCEKYSIPFSAVSIELLQNRMVSVKVEL